MKIRKIPQDGFEEVVAASDPATGLEAMIAIHSTKLGPSLGGIRMHAYPSEAEALKDVLLLAKAMTYKAAAAELKLGGGKAVIIGDSATKKSKDLLVAMGRFINQLEGRYLAAKDLGITTEDLVVIATETKYVTGLPELTQGSGDPSPWTAMSILEGMRACLREKMFRADFHGVTVAIQGVGHVGFALAELLFQEKAKVVVSDVNIEATKQARSVLETAIVPPSDVHRIKVDIFSPCAFGGVIHDQSIPELQCQIIAGGANNQLVDEKKHGRMLQEKGILYAPDYIINAGGLINIYAKDILKEQDSMPWIEKIEPIMADIFKMAKEEKISTAEAANLLTERTLKGA